MSYLKQVIAGLSLSEKLKDAIEWIEKLRDCVDDASSVVDPGAGETMAYEDSLQASKKELVILKANAKDPSLEDLVKAHAVIDYLLTDIGDASGVVDAKGDEEYAYEKQEKGGKKFHEELGDFIEKAKKG